MLVEWMKRLTFLEESGVRKLDVVKESVRHKEVYSCSALDANKMQQT